MENNERSNEIYEGHLRSFQRVIDNSTIGLELQYNNYSITDDSNEIFSIDCIDSNIWQV